MKKFALALFCMSGFTFADDILLFNGKTLDGWHGDPKFWKVENGAITGESTEKNPLEKTTYLRYTKKEVDDFELTLRYRFLSKSGNSGIQYRSKFFPANYQIVGYQADMETGQRYSGILYDQGGRGIVAKRGQEVTISANGQKEIKPLVSGAKAQASIKLGEWNTYKIIADGNSLTHIINGHKTVEVIDNDSKHKDLKGSIALQLHSGPAMKIQFKEINLLELHHKSPQAQAKWIWANKLEDEQIVTFTKEFELKSLDNLPMLSFTCDNKADLFINGKKAGSITDWKQPQRIDPKKFLKVGKNTIRVRAINEGGIAAFVLSMGKILTTDETWTASGKGIAPHKAKVIALHGDAPWKNILKESVVQDKGIKTLPGFKTTELYKVPKNQGSWVSLVFDDKGQLYCSSQYGDLHKVILKDGKVASITKIKSPGKAQGLMWAHGSLYMSVSSKQGGIFRLSDTNNDGNFDKEEKLVTINTGSEHGSHNIRLAPDGGFYYIAGNYTALPKDAKSPLNNNWKEDHLLQRLFDSRGHAKHVRAPGGYILHFQKDGKNPTVVANGFRNPYGLAISPQGDIFTYDADMEWDAGTPWYRPTRVLHATIGSEFGWRTGTSKWPSYFADSLPSVIDIGPGSPTGTIFGTGANFPQKYQDAMYILDWTFGVIYAIHLTPSGASYTAEKEIFIQGKPLPVADATIGPDGHMYFVTGGRRLASALHRVEYTGNVAKSTSTLKSPPLRPLLDQLVNSPSKDLAWENLNHKDRRISYTARFTLERLPIPTWIDDYRKETDSSKIIQASIAMARLEKNGELILEKLISTDFKKLTKMQQLSYLRALSLCYIRTNHPITSEQSQKMKTMLESHFPVLDHEINTELARLLTKLESKRSIDQILTLMESAIQQAQKIDKNLLKGNQKFGKGFEQMLRNQPNTKGIQFALILMSVEKGWDATSVLRYFTWLNGAEQSKGGNSYKGFITNMKKKVLKILPADLKKIANAAPKPKAKDDNFPIAKGPGRKWTLEEAIKATTDLSKADFTNGQKMFKATSCAQCHIHGNKGGDSGPNLTNLATRFNKKDILKAIIHPSEEISEQYHFEDITMKDGSVKWGRVIKEEGGKLFIAPSAYFLAATVEFPLDQVVSRTPSKRSPMYPGLINALSEKELRDLMKFLTNAK